jgi:hypothetical protein
VFEPDDESESVRAKNHGSRPFGPCRYSEAASLLSWDASEPLFDVSASNVRVVPRWRRRVVPQRKRGSPTRC